LVKLRLRRMGRKKLPIYKIVAADSHAPRDGRFIELLGTYNPGMNPVKIDVNETRVMYWLNNGALPTFTVKNLLSRKGLLLKLHLRKKKADESKIEEEFTKWSATQESKLRREAEKRVIRKEKRKKTRKKAEKTEQPDQSTTPSQ